MYTGDLAESTDLTTILTFTSSETMKCMLISAIQDHVIESTESLRVELSVMTNLPAAIQHNLQLGTSSTTITIQDTSKPFKKLHVQEHLSFCPI